MRDYTKFYINGAWVAPSGSDTLAVENPATLEQCATIAIGNETDVDTAVAAAKAAFETFSQTSVEERAALLALDRVDAPVQVQALARAGLHV